MKRICLLLAMVCAFGMAGWTAASARGLVFNLTDYGIVPDGSAGDLSAKLERALRAISAKVGDGDEVVVKFKKGRYDFHAADARGYELYVSNHDQDQPKRVVFYLDGWKNLTLDGNGSDFVFHGRLVPVAVRNCEDCTLKNFSIDFEQPQITQAEIVENSGQDGITFRVLEGTDYRIGQNGRFEIYGEGWTMQPVGGIAFEAATRHIVYNTGDISCNTAGVKDLGNRLMQAPNWKDDRLVPGTRVAMRSWARPCPGIFLDENVNTTLKNVKVHYAEGMGLIAQRCENITLEKFSVCLRGKDDVRYFTTQADATHFSQCRGSIISKNGLYEGMMDDAINIHGVYLKVRERIDDHTLRCRFEHDQAWGFAWGDVGDTVSFVRSATMEVACSPTVITAIKPADKPEIKGCREYIITVRDALPKEINAAEGYGIENLTWTPEVVFSGNTVRNNRARGALFSSPRRTVCENNFFDHTSGTAILLCGDCNGWYESGAVRDLVIRRNKFVNALTNMFQFTNAVISIYPEIPDLSGQKTYFHGGTAGAIVIEDNEFDTFDAPLLYAKSVDGLVFRNNKVKKNDEYAPFHWNRQPVMLEHCTNTEIPDYDVE
ncbi:MAG: alpha-1,3-galactosidase B [Bacteroidales bacterium]|nr:alpha-1,3-galactosidase B [Bacteroidales bacterium]